MEKEIENLIEQLTKVRPELLNEEALKLFNTIMALLDDRDNLKERLKEQIEHHEELMNALETYYGITEENIEKCIKEDI